MKVFKIGDISELISLLHLDSRVFNCLSIPSHDPTRLVLKLVTDRENYCAELYSGQIDRYHESDKILKEIATRLGYKIPKHISQLKLAKPITMGSAEYEYVRATEWLDGDPFDYSSSELVSASKCLALLHQEAIKVDAKLLGPLVMKKKLIESYSSEFPIRFQNVANEFIRANLDVPLYKPIIAWLNRYDSKLRDEMNKCVDFAQENTKVYQTSLFHGDITPQNIVFKNHKVSGIIDFNSLKYDYCIRDLVWSSITFSVYSGISTENQLNSLDRFISEYCKVNPFIIRELNDFYRFSLMRFIKIFMNQMRKSSLSTGMTFYDTTPYLEFLFNNKDSIERIISNIR